MVRPRTTSKPSASRVAGSRSRSGVALDDQESGLLGHDRSAPPEFTRLDRGRAGCGTIPPGRPGKAIITRPDLDRPGESPGPVANCPGASPAGLRLTVEAPATAHFPESGARPMPALDRLTATDGALLVVDVQEKLLRAIRGRDRVIANAVRLVRAAELLEIPVFATEQYPEGLGPTLPELAELIPDRPAKTTFHCCAASRDRRRAGGRHVRHVTLVGIEAHVCVAQTALELLRLGYRVQVPADAVGSRRRRLGFALRRLERAGPSSPRPKPSSSSGPSVRAPAVQGDQRPGQGRPAE